LAPFYFYLSAFFWHTFIFTFTQVKTVNPNYYFYSRTQAEYFVQHCQRLGPRSSTKNWLRHFAHPSPNFYAGSRSAKFGLWDPLLSKRSNSYV